MTDRPAADTPPQEPAEPRSAPIGVSARTRRALGLPEPEQRSAARSAAHRMLERVGGPVGLAATAAPATAFVVADAAAGLGTAFVALGVTAGLACVVRLARRESPGAALAGLLVAGICAAVAAVAGEARAFFLPTTVLPVVFVLAHTVSLAAGRPLMGLVVNRLAGGPRNWWQHRPLRRLYLLSSVIGLAMAVANLLGRVGFYLADQPAALAAIQVLSTSAFAAHFAVTLVVARRVTSTTRTPVPFPSPTAVQH
ncbi:DUF3159 domain-containing protein [Kineococcus sp. SYSU DK003]|uniref:DUF3159 domain-containing protein n=1 Tax=Kineococcus sp. SYSU DK003 TaxID=3383124 RepID=UPI003D7D4041